MVDRDYDSEIHLRLYVRKKALATSIGLTIVKANRPGGHCVADPLPTTSIGNSARVRISRSGLPGSRSRR